VQSFTGVGEVITYSYTVTDNTAWSLTNVNVSDPMAGLSPISCPGTTLAAYGQPGDSMTCTATYTVTANDVENGSISNTGEVTGNAANGQSVYRGYPAAQP
jgi:hypothetical protein